MNKTKNAATWLKDHLPTRRRIIQLYAALLTNANLKGFATGRIYAGEGAVSKYMCVPGLNCYSCPGAVRACPLGSLQNALASSNTRTPVYILGILALFGVLLGRTICGFLCPFGLVQDLLHKIPTPKLKKNRVTRVLVVLVVLVSLAYMLRDLPVPGFCKYICPAGTLGGAISLLLHPDNNELFGMLGPLFTWKLALPVSFLVSWVFIYRTFCRFFCPLGAIYGFFNKIALLGVKCVEEKCTHCGLCVSHCKMDIRRVGDHECIQCGACMDVCPTKAIEWKGSKIFLKDNEGGAPAKPRKGLKYGLRAAAVIVLAAALEFLQTKGWLDTATIYAHTPVQSHGRPTRELFTQYGGKDSFPMTVIISPEGQIVFQQTGAVSYEELAQQVQRIFG